MATYTDLHNRVKENVTVDYYSRTSPQEVHFLNENNEYWGTLRGNVSAQNICIDGGKLVGVELIDPKISGSIAVGGIDVNKVTSDVKAISVDLKDLKSSNDIEHDKMLFSLGKHDGQIGFLSAAIDTKTSSSSMKQEFAVLCGLIKQEVQAAVDACTTRDDGISAATDAAVDHVSAAVDHVSAATDAAVDHVSAAVDHVSAAAVELSDSLQDQLDTLSLKLGSEIVDRVAADEKQAADLCKAEEAAAAEHEKLAASIQSLSAEHDASLAELEASMAAKVEKQRHYSIESERLTDTWPYGCKDFAVNVYKAAVKDGNVAYVAPDGVEHCIGEVLFEGEDTIFKTYSEMTSKQLESALCLNYKYRFTPSNLTVPSKKNGYSIELSKNDGQLKFTLLPQPATYRRVTYFGQQVGKVFDAACSFDGSIVSGLLHIDTDDTQLEAFNKFKDVVFDSGSLSVVPSLTASEQIRYLGGNKMRFLKNVAARRYASVKDEDGVEFAQLLEGSFSPEASSIGVTLADFGEPDTQTVKLEAASGWSVSCSPDISTATVLSADVTSDEAVFTLADVRELFSYSFIGVEETARRGVVIPAQFNKLMPESKSFSEVSVDLREAVDIDAFKQTYVLHSSEDGLWRFEELDEDSGLVLNIKFNGSELCVKVSSASGAIEASRFIVDFSSPTPVDVGGVVRHVSLPVKLGEYPESINIPGEQYDIELGAVDVNEDLQTYELNVDTDDCNIVKICVPERTSDDISREFAVIVKPTSAVNKLVELQLTDKHGTKAKYICNRRDKLLVPTNTWTNLQVNEISHNLFFIKDFDGNEDKHDVRVLSAAIDHLSADSYESINELSVHLSANDAKIDDIYSRIKGGIVYKSTVCMQWLDNGGHIVDAQSISAMLLNTSDGYTPSTTLSSGFMYIVKKLDGELPVGIAPKMKLKVEGLSIEVGDSLVINCDDGDAKALSDITAADIDVIDAEDYDTVHMPELVEVSVALAASTATLSAETAAVSAFLSTELDSLSTKLSAEVDALSASLSVEVDALSASLSVEVDALSVSLSAEVDVLSASLSNEIDSLSASLSADVNALSARISADVQQISTGLSTAIDGLSAKHALDADSLSSNIDSISAAADLSVASLNAKANTIAAELLSAETRYTNTFTPYDSASNTHISSDNLILTDTLQHIAGGGTVHKRWCMSFEDGTIVLKPL